MNSAATSTLRNRTTLARYDKFYQNIYPTNLDEATREVVTLGAYNSRNDRTNAFSQTDLVRGGPVAGIDQTLLAGLRSRPPMVAQPPPFGHHHRRQPRAA